MRRMLLPVLLVVGMAMSGCASFTIPGSTPSEQPEQPGGSPQEPAPYEPERPVSSDDTVEPLPTPTPIEGDVIIGEAMVESIEIVFLESFPLQVNVIARGSLPDGCTTIYEVTQEREGDTFKVTITTIRPADLVCTQALVPFEEVVPLDVYGLEAGTYTVDVNGVTGTFTLDVDNIIPDLDEGDDQGGVDEFEYDLAVITDVEVDTGQGAPELTIRGYLPDACTSTHLISDRLEGNTVYVTVETRRPRGMMCPQVLTEFEERFVVFSVPPGPGSYTLVVNDFVTQFTMP